MNYMVWLLLGLIAVMPLLLAVHNLRIEDVQKILGGALIVTAVIYSAFSIVWGDAVWFVIEAIGVLIFGLFYWQSCRSSMIWLSLGWLLHPLWDGLLHLFGPGKDIAPEWYAVACMSFDVAVSVFILLRVKGIET